MQRHGNFSSLAAPPRPPSALTSFHTWELLCLQLEYFTRTGLQCVCRCGIRISNALFTVWLICHQIRHLVHYFVNYIGGDSFDKMSRLLKNIHICWYGKTDVTSNTNKTLLLIHSQHTCICIDTMLQWLLQPVQYSEGPDKLICRCKIRVLTLLRRRCNTSLHHTWLGCPCTPALATSQPQCEFTETIPTSPIIIHTADVGFIGPGKYRLQIIAQWQKFQGNLQIWENGISGLQFSYLTKLFTQESNNLGQFNWLHYGKWTHW